MRYSPARVFAAMRPPLVGACRALAAAWVLAPPIGWLVASHGRVDWIEFFGAAVMCAGLAAAPLLLRPMQAWAGLWYAALDLLSTAAVACVALTGELPSLGLVLVTWRSPWREASAVARAAIPALLPVMLATVLWAAGCISLLQRPWRSFAGAWKFALLGPLAVALLPQAATAYPRALVGIAEGLSQFSARYPFIDRQVVDDFPVKREADWDEVVVLVIGESSGAAHWQLYGYGRATTPNMQRRRDMGELAVFPYHMATATITLFAVPTLLSPFQDLGGLKAPPPRRSLVSVMARAGFHTAWFSGNDPAPAATEAQTIVYRTDDAVSELDTRYDAWLAGQLGGWLRRTPGPAFAVLHTYGSHLPFQDRYPQSFRKWAFREEAGYPNNQTPDNYDNSILYTDAVLEAIVTRLEHDGRPALLAYTSDHAESLVDGHVSRADAPRDERSLHVPLFFWASSVWRHLHAREWQELQQAAARGTASSHVDLVPTLSSALAISYEGKPVERDMTDPRYRPWANTPALDRDEATVLQVALPRGAVPGPAVATGPTAEDPVPQRAGLRAAAGVRAGGVP